MYIITLFIHSWTRWLLLILLVFFVLRAVLAYVTQGKFRNIDQITNMTVVSFAHIQLLVGFILYMLSPTVTVFTAMFSESIHERSLRFFGMEHPLAMLISIVVISVGAYLIKRSKFDNRKFKLAIIFYGISLVMILISIPWEFSPLVSRPLFRFI
jgi:ABC-type glycerol-3-phosphate transport system permease component